ncbi:MAG: calcium/proton exchanger [Chloroflexota bacterium]|nr:MAG: calcium/proton exchanger [Chloroflexota bacterium]
MKHRRVSVLQFLTESRLNILVVFLPVALVLRLSGGSDVLVFVASALAIIPLAGIIGHATDEIAKYVGPGVGGFLNATFGNATELIIVLLALDRGLTEVVKASLSGSILGNILLVLGLAMLVGGWGRVKQVFNRTHAGASAVMLVLAVVALVMPDIFALTVGEHDGPRVMQMSILVSIVMLITYVASLVFSLRTHREILTTVGHAETEPPRLRRGPAIALLAVATVATAVAAETLVGVIEPTGRALGLSEFFIGIVVVAIIGNAAEHFAAVWLARDNKMDLAVTIAVSSGTQIALLVAPIAVLASVAMGHPMALVFNHFELGALMMSVIAVAFATMDGESNWFEGVQLLAIYAIMAIVFFFVPGSAIH